MKHVVITGASTGIGRACAINLVQRGFHVFGSVRNQQDARPLKESLGNLFTALLFDVTDENAIARAAEVVKKRVGNVGLSGLVNNAGIVVNGPLIHVPIDLVGEQFDVNVLGVLRVTQAFVTLLGGQKTSPYPPGRIVNISSISGRMAFPFLGAYAASKHALEGMSEALRRELTIYGIEVIVIEPFNVRTPIFDKQAPVSPYRDTDYGPAHQRMLDQYARIKEAAMPVEVVANAVWTALTSAKPKTRYTLPRRRRKELVLPRFVYERLLDKHLAAVFRKLWQG